MVGLTSHIGRFLQVDPVRGGSANDYDYGNADPINNVDRTGNIPLAIAERNGRDGWGIVHAAHYGYLKALKAAAARGRATWKSSWNRSLERSRRASAERRSWIKSFTHAKAISWRTAYDYANDLIWMGIRAEVRRLRKAEWTKEQANRRTEAAVAAYIGPDVEYSPNPEPVFAFIDRDFLEEVMVTRAGGFFGMIMCVAVVVGVTGGFGTPAAIGCFAFAVASGQTARGLYRLDQQD